MTQRNDQNNDTPDTDQLDGDNHPQDDLLDPADADSTEDASPTFEEAPPQRVASPQTPEPRVLQIPTSTMKKIKDGERERGRANTLTELNVQAKKLGFRSHEELMASAAQFRARPKQQAQQPAAQGDGEQRESPRKVNALERDVQRLTEERKRQNRRIADLEKENKRLQAQLNVQETESTLRVAAARHGVKDVDYALHVCRAHCAKLTPEQQEAFNEDQYFAEKLKETHSYLYAVEDRLVTTTPTPAGSAAKPASPAAPQVVDPNAAGVDATKLSPEKYRELLKSRGLTDPGVNAYAG